MFAVSIFGTGLMSHQSQLSISSRGPPGIGFKLDEKNNYDMDNKKLVNVATPENPQDVVNKSYLEEIIINYNGSDISENKVLEMKAEIASLRDKIYEFGIEITTCNELTEAMKLDFTTKFNEQKAKVEMINIQIKRKLSNLEVRLQELNVGENLTESPITILNDKIETDLLSLQNKIEEIQNVFTLKIDEINSQGEELKNKNQSFQERLNEINEIKLQLTTLKEKIENDIATLQRTVSQMEEDLTNLTTKIEQIILNNVDDKLENLGEKLGEIVNETNTRLDQCISNISSIREKAEEINFDEIKSDIYQIKNNVESLEEKVSELGEIDTILSLQLNELKQNNIIINNDVNNIRNKNEELKTEFEEIGRKIDNVNKSVDDVNNTLGTEISEIKEKFKEFEDGVVSKIDDLKETDEQIKSDIESKTDQFASDILKINEQIKTELVTKVEQNSSKITRIELKEIELQTNVDTLEQKVNSFVNGGNDSQLSELKKKDEELEGEIFVLKNTTEQIKNEISAKIEETNKNIDRIFLNEDKLLLDVETLKEKFQNDSVDVTVQTELSNLKENITNLQNSTEQTTLKQNTQENQISQLEDKIQSVETDLNQEKAQLNTRVSELEEKIKDIGDEYVTNVKLREINEQRDRINDHRQQFILNESSTLVQKSNDKLKKELEENKTLLNSFITNINTKLYGMQDGISSLFERVYILENPNIGANTPSTNPVRTPSNPIPANSPATGNSSSTLDRINDSLTNSLRRGY